MVFSHLTISSEALQESVIVSLNCAGEGKKAKERQVRGAFVISY